MYPSEDLPANISYIPLSQLAKWDRNYRRGDVDAIAKSISGFGFNHVLRVRDGVVMAGNHAFKALVFMEEHCWPIPKNIIADPAGGWLIPCVDLSHLSEAEAEAFAIADNKTQELGTTDQAQLVLLLEELGSADPELLGVIGYSSDELDRLIGPESPPEFAPGSSADQGALDSESSVTCPECGHQFSPA